MSNDIVVISDTEEYHFINEDFEDEDDGIAFVGHAKPRSSAVQGIGLGNGAVAIAGPSTLGGNNTSIPIFIDSDDDADDDNADDQDIHSFLSAELGLGIPTTSRPTLTINTNGNTRSEPKSIAIAGNARTKTAPTVPEVGRSTVVSSGASRWTKSLSNTATRTAIDVDEYDDLTLDLDLDIQLVEAVRNNITATGEMSTTRKGKEKAKVIDLEGEEEVVVHEVRSSGRAFEDIQDEFDRFESSLLDNLEKSSSVNARPPTSTKTSSEKVQAVVAQRPSPRDQPVRSNSAIKEAIEKEKAKLSKKKRKSSANEIDALEATQLKEIDSVGKGKKRKKESSLDEDPAKKLSKEEKEAQKALEKAEKQLARETQKAAKEAEKSYQRKLAEVNRLRTSKNDTVREIHLYLSADLSHPTSPIAGALPEIKTRITDNHSELHFLPETESPINGMIRFKRHLKARWDPTKKQFIPLDQPKWVWEPSILMIINAEEIVDRIATASTSTSTSNPSEESLSTFIADVRLTLGLKSTDQMMVMIKGLNKYYSKSKSLANKEFTAAARAGLAGSGSAGTGGNSNGRAGGAMMTSRPDKETIEMELVKLQVKERCFLVHVEKTEDIEDWVYNIAADVALRPYKLISKSHLNFCPTDSVKRKSSNPTEAFELMLQEVTGITPSAAMGIAVEYPTFYDLMVAYEKADRRGGVDRAEGMLQDCQIKTLRNGTANGRKLNKALAKRVYNVFRGEDSLALA
ncbi:hypothetical protein IAT40_000856 [Kwoniella sp. CBS 6097]